MLHKAVCSPVRCFTQRVSRRAESLRGVHTRSTTSAACSHLDDAASGSAPGLTKKVVSSVVACAGAALADPLMSLVDTAFVGRLGVLQLAALGPNGALFNVVFFLGFSALGVVATNQISSAHGAGDRRAAGQSLILSCTVAFVLGLLITAILMLAPCSALQLFQTNPEMTPYAKDYCVIRALGVSSALLMVVFQAAFRAVEDMRTPLIVVAASGLLNAILDPILIYPLKMGIAGAAWATAASQVAGAAVFAVLVYSKRHIFGLPQAWDDARKTAVSQAWSRASMAAPQPLHTQSDPFHADASSGTSRHDFIAHHAQQTCDSSPGAHVVYPEGNAPTPRSVSPVARAAAPGGTAAAAPSPLHFKEPGTFHTVLALFQNLPWDEFITTSLKLAVRCLLVLSTWTFASIAATAVGTYTMAAYQIMQQVLQLQLSVCWAFLAVGQSLVGVAVARGSSSSSSVHKDPHTMHRPADAVNSKSKHTSNVWNASQRDARVVGTRVVGLAIAASLGMAALTFSLRSAVPRLFTSDVSVLKLVEGSALMMCLMLAISWNNAIEGVLLGAGDTQFVINVYPACVGAFLLALAGSVAAGWGLVGIWGALVLYYVGLSGTLSARYWMQRFRCKI